MARPGVRPSSTELEFLKGCLKGRVIDPEVSVSLEDSRAGQEQVSLAVSDLSQLRSLRQWLGHTPSVEVGLTPGQPDSGELGAVDVLTVLASSTGLVAAIKVLPEFIRSRRSGFRIETTVRGKRFVLDATNSDDLIPVIEKLLSD
jgi:hypothetical protein